MIETNSSLHVQLSSVLRRYLDHFDPLSFHYKKYTHGHIHHSYVVYHEHEPLYFLQKINRAVFSNTEAIIRNHSLVYTYIDEVEQQSFTLAKPIPLLDADGWYYRDKQGDAWRLVPFYTTHHSHQTCPTQHIAAQAGLAFGAYSHALNSPPKHRQPLTLQPTIPNFHSIAWRLQQYTTAKSSYTGPRLVPYEEAHSLKGNPSVFDLSQLDTIVQSHAQKFTALEADLTHSEQQHPRLAHNDTKLNNVLLSTEHEPPIIIDLDTTMPGSILYDLGDGLRTIGLSGAEDEANLDLLVLHMDFCSAFREAFLHQVDSLLNKTEQRYIHLAGSYMAYIMGLRFLTDYLNGNVYYATEYETHNLIRSRNQFHLLHLMMEEANG